jgi:hypothetical protein
MKPRSPGKKKPGAGARCKEARLSVVGVWKNRTDLPDTETYFRSEKARGWPVSPNEKAAQVAPDGFFSSGCARRDLVPEGTYLFAIYF